MTLDVAMQWLSSHGGKVHVVRRTEQQEFYQVVVEGQRSQMIGFDHEGRIDIPTDDPAFERGFIEMVETVKAKVDLKPPTLSSILLR